LHYLAFKPKKQPPIGSFLEDQFLLRQPLQAEAGKEEARFALQKRIQEVDQEIDARVYRLYGLTEEEIRVVEGK
jgi:hypothetical protein